MNRVKIKTAELEGAALDWAVGVAVDGKCIDCHGPVPCWTFPTLDAAVWAGNVDIGIIDRYQPSTDWSQGGPLIEKYQIGLDHIGSDWHGEPLNFWVAPSHDTQGETPLIAACRAIVSAKLGAVVEVPGELLK